MTQSRPVALRLDEHWLWDFWFARDGDDVHVFYLQAPRVARRPRAAPRQRDDRPRRLARPARAGRCSPTRSAPARPARSTTSPPGPAASSRHDGALAPLLHRHRARRGRRRCSGSAVAVSDDLCPGSATACCSRPTRAGTTASTGATPGSSGTSASASTCSSAPRAAAAASSATRTSPDLRVEWTIGPPLSAPTGHVQLEVPQILHARRRLADPVLRRLRRLRPPLPLRAASGSAPTRARRRDLLPGGRPRQHYAGEVLEHGGERLLLAWLMEDERRRVRRRARRPDAAAALQPGRPAVPVVLERPARADRPGLHAVGQPRRLELARRASTA